MRDLILKILKEGKGNYDYMGIRLSNVKSSLPKQYLVKKTKETEKENIKKEKLKNISNKINSIYIQIDDDFRNLNWQDIKFNHERGFIFFIVPQKIKNKINKLSSLYEELLNEDYLNFVNPREKINQLYLDNENFIKDDFIYLYVDTPRNRTHFPKGLPKSLLGYDLGIKLYRKLLDELGFIQSEPNATQSVQAIYRRLLGLPDVNTILYDDLVLIIDKNISKEEKIEILKQSVYERYKTKRRKLVLGKTIVLDSSLKREIGEKKVLNIIDQSFYEKYSEQPFSNIGYQPNMDENFAFKNLILIL